MISGSFKTLDASHTVSSSQPTEVDEHYRPVKQHRVKQNRSLYGKLMRSRFLKKADSQVDMEFNRQGYFSSQTFKDSSPDMAVSGSVMIENKHGIY